MCTHISCLDCFLSPSFEPTTTEQIVITAESSHLLEAPDAFTLFESRLLQCERLCYLDLGTISSFACDQRQRILDALEIIHQVNGATPYLRATEENLSHFFHDLTFDSDAEPGYGIKLIRSVTFPLPYANYCNERRYIKAGHQEYRIIQPRALDLPTNCQPPFSTFDLLVDPRSEKVTALVEACMTSAAKFEETRPLLESINMKLKSRFVSRISLEDEYNYSGLGQTTDQFIKEQGIPRGTSLKISLQAEDSR